MIILGVVTLWKATVRLNMTAKVLAVVRIVSVADKFEGRGVTKEMLQRVVGPVRGPEDRYHVLAPSIQEANAHRWWATMVRRYNRLFPVLRRPMLIPSASDSL